MATEFWYAIGRDIASEYGLFYSGIDRIQNVDEAFFVIGGKRYRAPLDYLQPDRTREVLRALLESDGYRLRLS